MSSSLACFSFLLSASPIYTHVLGFLVRVCSVILFFLAADVSSFCGLSIGVVILVCAARCFFTHVVLLPVVFSSRPPFCWKCLSFLLYPTRLLCCASPLLLFFNGRLLVWHFCLIILASSVAQPYCLLVFSPPFCCSSSCSYVFSLQFVDCVRAD